MVSDDHEGIKAVVFGELCRGVGWQRCVVHFQRNVLAHVPASQMREVAQDLKAILRSGARRRRWPCPRSSSSCMGSVSPRRG